MDVAALDAALAPWRADRAKAARAKSRISRSPTTRKYWEARAVPKTFEDKLTACGAQGKGCAHCGAPIVRYCNARLVCPGCGKRAWAKARRRIQAGLEARLDEAHHAWRRAGRKSGEEPRISLLTMTVRHSGDVRADRRLLSKAWHRWRAWYLQAYGDRLLYAWTIEYTPGADDRGHVHMHVCTMLPFRRFQEFHEAWRRATEDDENKGVHVSPAKTRSAHRAAKYMAKYTTKGVGDLSIAHAQRWVEAQHGMRALSTSRGFYVPPPPACPFGTDGRHTFDREWLAVPSWTPSYDRATARLAAAGPDPPMSHPSAGTGAGPFSGPAQQVLALASRSFDQ